MKIKCFWTFTRAFLQSLSWGWTEDFCKWLTLSSVSAELLGKWGFERSELENKLTRKAGFPVFYPEAQYISKLDLQTKASVLLEYTVKSYLTTRTNLVAYASTFCRALFVKTIDHRTVYDIYLFSFHVSVVLRSAYLWTKQDNKYSVTWILSYLEKHFHNNKSIHQRLENDIMFVSMTHSCWLGKHNFTVFLSSKTY